VPTEGSDLGDCCPLFESEKIGDVGKLLTGTHRDMAVAMFRMEMDIDFHVRRKRDAH